MTSDREVIDLHSRRVCCYGFQGIRDPRSKDGVRLEMYLLTLVLVIILHNLRKTVERAGVKLENIIISP